MKLRHVGACGRLSSGKDSAANVLVLEYDFSIVSMADALKRLTAAVFDFGPRTLFGPSQYRSTKAEGAHARLYWEQAALRSQGAQVRDILVDLFDTQADYAREVLGAFVLEKLQPFGSEFSARIALQQLGTEYGREVDPDVWVNKVTRVVHAIGQGVAYDQRAGLLNQQARVPVGIVTADVRYSNEVQRIKEAGGLIWVIDAQERLPPEPPVSHDSEPRFEQQLRWADHQVNNNGTADELPLRVREVCARMGLSPST